MTNPASSLSEEDLKRPTCMNYHQEQSCKEVCAFCRHWKLGTLNRDVRLEALENLQYCECHVKQPYETRADQFCSVWTEVGKA